MNQELITFLKSALECSVYIAPLDPGLTGPELIEIGRRAGFQDGEINDSILRAGDGYFGSPKYMPSSEDIEFWVFYQAEDPDYRNFAAFDFVFAELNALVRSAGEANARIKRRSGRCGRGRRMQKCRRRRQRRGWRGS